jgi:PAS domain S-box-containing protein
MNNIDQLQSDLTKAQSRILELEKSSDDNQIFLNIFNSSPVPYALNDEQGNIINLNPAFTKAFGYNIDDIPTLSDWWPKAYPDPKYREWVLTTWQKNLDKAQKTKTDFEPIELKIQCKNGTQRNILASAASLTNSYTGIHLVILYDITDTKQAKNQLGDLSHSLAKMNTILEQQHSELVVEKEKALANEERLRLAMQGTNDGLWDWDLANDTIYFSPRWKSMLGYTKNEIEDHVLTWKGLLHPDDVNRCITKIEIFLDKKTKNYESEFRMQHKNGEYINILSRAFAVESEEGVITRVVGTHLDITERKKAEILALANIELAFQNKEKDRLAD